MAKFHFMQNPKREIVLGLILFILGSLLLWDAWGHRGKNTPWPLGMAMPF
jgi:hypothetical protein